MGMHHVYLSIQPLINEYNTINERGKCMIILLPLFIIQSQTIIPLK